MFATLYLADRDTELDKLRHLLQPESRSHIIALSGPSGVGKSAVAIEAMRQSKDFFAQGTLYLDLAGTVALYPILVTLNYRVTPRLNMPSATLADSLATDLLSILTRANVLLVFDNLETSLAQKETLRFIAQLPPTCKVLFTSSNPIPTADTNIAIDPLSPEDAWTLYKKLYVNKNEAPLSSKDVFRFTKGYPTSIRLLAALDPEIFLEQVSRNKAGNPSLIVDIAYATLNTSEQALAHQIALLPRSVSLALISMGTWGNWEPLPELNQLQSHRLVDCDALKCRMSSLVARQIAKHITVKEKVRLYEQLAAAYLHLVTDALFEQEEVNWYVLDDQYPNIAAVLDGCYQAEAWQAVLDLSQMTDVYLQRVGWTTESLHRNQKRLEASQKLQDRKRSG
jgi:hypothetical protein